MSTSPLLPRAMNDMGLREAKEPIEEIRRLMRIAGRPHGLLTPDEALNDV